jgi:hypothetical protein
MPAAGLGRARRSLPSHRGPERSLHCVDQAWIERQVHRGHVPTGSIPADADGQGAAIPADGGEAIARHCQEVNAVPFGVDVLDRFAARGTASAASSTGRA